MSPRENTFSNSTSSSFACFWRSRSQSPRFPRSNLARNSSASACDSGLLGIGVGSPDISERGNGLHGSFVRFVSGLFGPGVTSSSDTSPPSFMFSSLKGSAMVPGTMFAASMVPIRWPFFIFTSFSPSLCTATTTFPLPAFSSVYPLATLTPGYFSSNSSFPSTRT